MSELFLEEYVTTEKADITRSFSAGFKLLFDSVPIDCLDFSEPGTIVAQAILVKGLEVELSKTDLVELGGLIAEPYGSGTWEDWMLTLKWIEKDEEGIPRWITEIFVAGLPNGNVNLATLPIAKSTWNHIHEDFREIYREREIQKSFDRFFGRGTDGYEAIKKLAIAQTGEEAWDKREAERIDPLLEPVDSGNLSVTAPTILAKSYDGYAANQMNPEDHQRVMTLISYLMLDPSVWQKPII